MRTAVFTLGLYSDVIRVMSSDVHRYTSGISMCISMNVNCREHLHFLCVWFVHSRNTPSIMCVECTQSTHPSTTDPAGIHEAVLESKEEESRVQNLKGRIAERRKASRMSFADMGKISEVPEVLRPSTPYQQVCARVSCFCMAGGLSANMVAPSGDRRFSDHRPGFGSTARQEDFFPRIFWYFPVFFWDFSGSFVLFRYSSGFFGKGSARGGNPGPRAPPGI